MHLRPILVGIVEIDAMADQTFLFESPHSRGLSRARWQSACMGSKACAILAADLPRLRDGLDSEFQRLQARLAA